MSCRLPMTSPLRGSFAATAHATACAAVLTADEVRRIGNAIARIPELFLMQREEFHPRGSGPRWRVDRPYRVAIEDHYLRENWFEINALCTLNSLPMNATGETVRDDGTWRASMNSLGRWTQSRSGPLQGTLDAWLRISLSRTADQSPGIKASRQFADIKSAR